jgi:hypothetical protein
MNKLLLLGGCHVLDDVVSSSIEANFTYQQIDKLNSYLTKGSWVKTCSYLNQNALILREQYDFIVQLDHIVISNKITNILPGFVNSYFIRQQIDYSEKYAFTDIDDIGLNNPRFYILKECFKILVFPLNLIRVLTIGRNRLKRIKTELDQLKKGSNILIILLPFYNDRFHTKIIRNIGGYILKKLFAEDKNTYIIDSFELTKNPALFRKKDMLHLNESGMKLLTEVTIETLKKARIKHATTDQNHLANG